MVSDYKLTVGDVVQVSPSNYKFGGCFAVVEKVEGWGVVAYVIPVGLGGVAPVRLVWKEMEYIGHAAFQRSRETEPPAPVKDIVEARSLVAKRNLEPYVSLWRRHEDGSEQQLGQFSPDEAVDFALNVLRCAEASQTDAFLYEFLNTLGIGQDQAGAVLVQMREFRERKRAPEKVQ